MRAHSYFVLFILASGCAGGAVQETSDWLTTEYPGFTARSQTTSQGIISELSSTPDGALVASLWVTNDRAVWTSSTGETRTIAADASASTPGATVQLPTDNETANEWLYLTTQTAVMRQPAALGGETQQAESGGCVNSGDCTACCDGGICCSCCGSCDIIVCTTP